MKYMEMLKNEKKDKNTLSDPLPKLPKGTYGSNGSLPSERISEKKDPFDHQIKLAIEELNERGASILDYPVATRHKALELEEKMTQVANRRDRLNFILLLRQWQKCFLN